MAEWSVPGYSALRELGSGGFGQVMLARHDATGTLVAIKYLRPDLLADEGFAEMFRGEAAVLASLEDPNIVRLYEYVESPAGAAIVMELVDGVSVREILKSAGATTAEAALVVLQGSLLGLHAAHRRGVVHRDYKPENVLVNGEGVSKLTDFGIAARAGDRPIPAGTLHYASPEQMAGAPASPASDVYSATATFYECLTGSPPFTGGAAQLMYKHSAEPVPLEPVPEPLRPLVAAGMAKDPQSRPGDAGSFVTELRTVAGDAYGQDWADRGRSHLGEAALLLAALWPSAAAPATQGATVVRISLLRRISSRVSPVKAAIVVGAAAAVVAGGVAVAGLTHHGPAGKHRTHRVHTAAGGLPGRIIYQIAASSAGAACTPSRCWTTHEISPTGAGDRLLHIGDEFCCYSPAISPDGTKLVFTGAMGMMSVTDLNGHPAHGQWGGYPGNFARPRSLLDPAWSPSGKQIAYIFRPGPGQTPEIDVVKADGTGRRPVIKASLILPPITWSPDGTQLAFATTSGTIAVVRVAGGPARALVTGVPGGVTGLSWAPGPRVLFTTRHGPGIWEANGHGGAKAVLECHGCISPSWAPDGVHFAAARPGRGVIVASVVRGVQATIGPPEVAYVQWGGPDHAVSSPPPPSRSSKSAPPPGLQLTLYKVCAFPAAGPCGLSEMKTEPTRIVASMTGSRYVDNITWSGWGSATAHGTGVLQVDNCNPSCAQGSFNGYPATVTLSGLARFGHGEHAYSVIVISAPNAPVNPAALSFSGPYLVP